MTDLNTLAAEPETNEHPDGFCDDLDCPDCLQRAKDEHNEFEMQRWKDGEIAINGRYRGQR